ncbi:aldo-keto reductase, putative [Perkinsus marinus ATCC 50983]|uniref:Aldo-keto reductase, putative n=1 Tax=Perkinsus marinus (strain ATCC 50983 / TXsc) TaxID=423536 RepID=C5KP51_PERM5|nr:aldo-keto reductase, putative [Perkinsus marinus ATCC 50983]EER13726.1 aldo-keto reductase, putative [Perkinsus marinus ATCC 50983]|eukprot:XP_002781931.1 aldo-keto reductase, putative [Perkinsus marinus ATCC 50983]
MGVDHVNILPPPGLAVVIVLAGEACEASVYDALQAGYRWIDTASVYKNEVEVGRAVTQWLEENQSGGGSERITVTTKISPYELLDAKAASLACFQRLSLPPSVQTVLLVHWPGVARKRHDMTIHREARNSAWKVLCDLKHDGLVDIIGVSNFNINHLEWLAHDLSTEAWYEGPSINQVEMHARCQQRALKQYCKERNILLQAYGPFGSIGAPLLSYASQRLGLDRATTAELERVYGILPPARWDDGVVYVLADLGVHRYNAADGTRLSFTRFPNVSQSVACVLEGGLDSVALANRNGMSILSSDGRDRRSLVQGHIYVMSGLAWSSRLGTIYSCGAEGTVNRALKMETGLREEDLSEERWRQLEDIAETGVESVMRKLGERSGGELAAMINQLMTGGATIISAQEINATNSRPLPAASMPSTGLLPFPKEVDTTTMGGRLELARNIRNSLEGGCLTTKEEEDGLAEDFAKDLGI